MAMTAEQLNALASLVGQQNVDSRMEKRIVYSFDGTFKEHLPDVVVKPHTTDEVAAVVRLAYEQGIPLTARGAGTGLSGGAVPMAGGILLEMTAFDRIVEINEIERYAVIQPGVVTSDLAQAVRKVGLFYPPDPSSQGVSTLGGNVAECAGGGRGVKYGVTRDYVLALEVVLPDGQLMTVGNAISGQTGWLDLPMLFTGSEGTLGIITEITLRLIDPPTAKRTALAKFMTLDAAARTVSAIIGRGIIPTTIEIMDQMTMEAVENFLQLGLDTDKKAYLLLEVDGESYAVADEMAQVVQICQDNQAVDVQLAQDQSESDRLWQARRSISGACGKLNPTKIGEDITVPRSQVPAMIQAIGDIAQTYQLKIVVFGHAGDGNLHPNILTDQRNHDEMIRVQQAIRAIAQQALALGGTLSGEHGIGTMKAPFLRLELGDAGYDAQKMIKDVFDEKGYLNPLKMFVDDERL